MRKSFIAALGVLVLSVAGLAACQKQSDKKAEPAAASAPIALPTDPVDLRAWSKPELVPIPVTRTETETMNCVNAGLKADGTAAQATNLAVGTQVTINGEKVALPEGGSYYSLCKGATPEQRLAATTTNLERTTAAFNDANSTLKTANPWIYVDTKNGGLVRGNTWNYVALEYKKDLGAAVTWDFVQYGLIIILLLAFLAACFRETVGLSRVPFLKWTSSR